MAMPERRPEETDAAYRARLVAWYAATADRAATAELRAAEWRYLCSLAGVPPGKTPGPCK